jgi:hypothetical protein
MGRVYGKSVELIMSSCPHGIRPSSQGRPPPGRGRVRDVEIFTRKPAREKRPRAGFLTPRHAPRCAAEAPQDDSSAESKLRRFGPPTGTDEKYSAAWRGTGRGARYSPRTPAARIRRTGDLHEISQRRFLKQQHVRREVQRSWRSRPQCCRSYNLCALHD